MDKMNVKRGLKIIVLIKQVPDTDKVKIDPESGTMIREGFEAVMNTFDLHALELALRIKETVGGSVRVISMGPPNTKDILREALALGADSATLVSDRIFAGADTLATSLVLKKVIEKYEFDLILAGEKATDGETGQVGPEVGAMMDLPVVTYVSKLLDVREDKLIVERSVEDGTEEWEVDLPALLTVSRSVSEPRFPTLSGKKRAMKMDIEVLGFSDLGLRKDQVGLIGSPTRVVKVFNVPVTRETEMYEGKSVSDGIDRVVELLRRFSR